MVRLGDSRPMPVARFTPSEADRVMAGDIADTDDEEPVSVAPKPKPMPKARPIVPLAPAMYPLLLPPSSVAVGVTTDKCAGTRLLPVELLLARRVG